MLTVAHLSDPHFGNRPGVADRSRRVATTVERIRPDVVVITGDVADHGRPEEYAEALAVLGSLPVPVLWGTGNHDVREPFAEALLMERCSAPRAAGRSTRRTTSPATAS